MIIMRLRGRLGNQLFIYSFGRYLQHKYKQELVLLDNENDTGGTMLEKMCIPNNTKIIRYKTGFEYKYYKMSANDYKKIGNSFIDNIKREFFIKKQLEFAKIPNLSKKQLFNLLLYKIAKKNKNQRELFEYEKSKVNYFSKNGLFLCENGYVDFPNVDCKNIFCFGYFQSEKYFSSIKEMIVKETTLKIDYSGNLKDYIRKIENSNSVCLSVRLGDYLNNPIHGVCNIQYYKEAIKKIQNMFPNTEFFISSDDIESCKSLFEDKTNINFEPKGLNEIEKLEYMSHCKHYILSNSSFSWWAQYLSKNQNKVVIAPNRWFAVDIPCDIYQDNWVLI